jgi:hypothetical protein
MAVILPTTKDSGYLASTGRQNAETFRQKWAKEFDTLPSSREAIYRMHDKFDETGSICNAPKIGRPVSVTIQENEMLVSQAFTKSPQK